jgi:Rab-GTPase-TBC domain
MSHAAAAWEVSSSSSEDVDGDHPPLDGAVRAELERADLDLHKAVEDAAADGRQLGRRVAEEQPVEAEHPWQASAMAMHASNNNSNNVPCMDKDVSNANLDNDLVSNANLLRTRDSLGRNILMYEDGSGNQDDDDGGGGIDRVDHHADGVDGGSCEDDDNRDDKDEEDDEDEDDEDDEEDDESSRQDRLGMEERYASVLDGRWSRAHGRPSAGAQLIGEAGSDFPDLVARSSEWRGGATGDEEEGLHEFRVQEWRAFGDREDTHVQEMSSGLALDTPTSKPSHSRSRSSSAVFTSHLKKGWKAVKRSSVKSTASASKQLSSISSSYRKSSTAASVRRFPMTPVERAAWEERQSRLCEEWTLSILPSWKKKRKATRTRDLAFRGIPPSLRGRVWCKALGNPLNVPPDLFDVLKDRARDGRLEYLRFRDAVDKADGDVGGHGGRAEPLILQERSAHKAIMLDLPRTFPELAFFHADGSEYEDSLREILEAFMYLRPDIGYSQGMSFLAAVLLLYIEDASEAFTCFVNMLLHKSCFLHFFRMQMPEVRIYLTMHDRFMREEMPALHAHFKLHAVEPEMYMINWVMSLYCGALPLDLVSRIWDVYVLDGDVAIFRAALGILKLLMPRLLSMNFEGIAYLLSHVPGEEIGGDALLRAIRGVQAVTKRSFKDAFRSCYARHQTTAEQQQQPELSAVASDAVAVLSGVSHTGAGSSSPMGTSPRTSSQRIFGGG